MLGNLAGDEDELSVSRSSVSESGRGGRGWMNTNATSSPDGSSNDPHTDGMLSATTSRTAASRSGQRE